MGVSVNVGGSGDSQMEWMSLADQGFREFRRILQEHFAEMTASADCLYEVNVDKDALWNLYLDSFPAGTRRRSEDCNCCRQFIQDIGNVVVIECAIVHTIWEVQRDDAVSQPVADALDVYITAAKALDAYIKAHAVTDVYLSAYKRVGTKRTSKMLPEGGVRIWDHLQLRIPNRFVAHNGQSIQEIKEQYQDARNVFVKALEEISRDAVRDVRELIDRNALYKGKEWADSLREFKFYQDIYAKIPEERRDLVSWEIVPKAGWMIDCIRNHAMETLLMNLTKGMDLDTAVREYETIVAPKNYVHTKVFSASQIWKDPMGILSELGYLNSLGRRHATLDDIAANNILFCSRDAARHAQPAADLFGEMRQEIAVDPGRFSGVQEIGIDAFVRDVLPTAASVEILLENRHAFNMVSLIAPTDKDSKSMFQWNNGFSWAYTGDLSDSMYTDNITFSNIRENVKAAGGRVDGTLRFSIQWNDGDYCPTSYHAHCIFLGDDKQTGVIDWERKRCEITGGVLDVETDHPQKGIPAVSNIIFPSEKRIEPGAYLLFVTMSGFPHGDYGFKAEVEFGGNIYSFDYREFDFGAVYVAVISYHPETGIFVRGVLPYTMIWDDQADRVLWGLRTNRFLPVSVIMYSPNCWDAQDGIGHRHYFFMLKDCVNPEQPEGFYQEFFKKELQHYDEAVFRIAGYKPVVQYVENQLSGLGFPEGRSNSLIVRVKGDTERILRIRF